MKVSMPAMKNMIRPGEREHTVADDDDDGKSKVEDFVSDFLISPVRLTHLMNCNAWVRNITFHAISLPLLLPTVLVQTMSSRFMGWLANVGIRDSSLSSFSYPQKFWSRNLAAQRVSNLELYLKLASSRYDMHNV